MNQPLIRLTEIAAAYDQKKVLEHINLEIAEKDFLGAVSYTHLTLPTNSRV